MSLSCAASISSYRRVISTKSAGVPRNAASLADCASSSSRTSKRSYNVRGCDPKRCMSGESVGCTVRLATNDPLPCIVSMIPRALRILRPSRSAVLETPSFSVRRLSEGSVWPVFRTPSTIKRSMRSATTSATCQPLSVFPDSINNLAGMTTPNYFTTGNSLRSSGGRCVS